MKMPGEHLAPKDWSLAVPFYRRLVQKLRDQGIQALITGGNACVFYGFAPVTKDCDIIVPFDKCDQVLAIVAETVFGGNKPHYHIGFGAPFSKRWLSGGWTSHLYFGSPKEPTTRLDFFAKPHRVDDLSCDEEPLYLSRDGLARMKKTCRVGDWPYVNFLGLQLIKERRDIRGLLHINSLPELVDCVANIELPLDLLQQRPLLRLAKENSPELERYVAAEKEFWRALDELRRNLYVEAWRPYGTTIAQDAQLPNMSLLEQHQRLLNIATAMLESDPVAGFGDANLIQEAKDRTQRIFGKLDLAVLPNPMDFPRSGPCLGPMRALGSIISEERYQDLLRKEFGEERAVICCSPYEERLKIIANYQQNFDTPRDSVWPAEGYTGPDLP